VALAVHRDSGRGAAVKLAETAAGRLRRESGRLDVIEAASVARFQDALQRSREAGLDVLVVLGGDGAVHQAVQGCAGTGVALGVVPCGTGNDFARALGTPRDPMAALERVAGALRSGNRRSMDAGRVGQRWFGTVLCAGFDAAVNARANRMRWPHGPRRYDVAVVAELASLQVRPLVVTTDTERFDIDATLVAVGNTGWYGGGVPICPSAEADDGLFDVTIVGRASRRDLVRILPRLRLGTHLRHPAVRTLQTRRVTLAGVDRPVYADGEPLGALPVTATCVPDALTVLG
jgi:diacylglycerol kinase (ATP)